MLEADRVETVLAVISYTLLVLLHVLALCVALSHLGRWYCKGRIFVKVGQFRITVTFNASNDMYTFGKEPPQSQ